MPPDRDMASAKSKPSSDQSKSKPSVDQASSSGKNKSSRRRSSHEHNRSRDEVDMEAAEAHREDPGTKQSETLVVHRNEAGVKSKKGAGAVDGGNNRGTSSSEKPQEMEMAEASHRGSKRRQNQVSEAAASEVGVLVRVSKRWRSEGAVVLAGPPTPPSPLDRWDGGQSQEEIGVAPLPLFDSGKQIASPLGGALFENSISIAPVNVPKEKASDGDSRTRKGKNSASRAGVSSESRQVSGVSIMESVQIDGVVSEANTGVKPKINRKKDTDAMELKQEKGAQKIERNSVEVGLPQFVEQAAEDLSSSRSRKSGSRRRWDGETGHKEKEHSNLHTLDHDSLEIKIRDKRKEKIVEVRDLESSRFEKEHVSEDIEPPAKRKSEDTDKRRRSSEDKEVRTSEWKIQEELRNIELEKELENRIRRRKEESSERDRWKDEDRDRESRRHLDHREDRIREQRHKEERSRRERHGDRHESKSYREKSKSLEGKSRDEMYHETDRDHKVPRNEPISYKESFEQNPEVDHELDQDTRERRVRSGKDVAIDAEHRGNSKNYKEELPERESITLHHSNVEIDDPSRKERVQKKARETLSLDSGIKDREQTRKKTLEKDMELNREESEFVPEDKVHSRNREERDREGSFERLSDHPREQQRGKYRSERRLDGRSNDGIMSPYHDSRASPSSRVDGSSPVADERVPSIYTFQRSPSPAVFDGSRPVARVKSVRSEWLEPTYSMSSSSGTHRRRDSSLHTRDRGERSRRHAAVEEEVRSGDLGSSRKVLDEIREGSPSPRRSHDYHLPLPPLGPQSSRQESFSRASAGRNSLDTRTVNGREEAVSRDQEPWRTAFQSGVTPFDSRSSDDLHSRERVDRARHGPPVNRSISSPMARAQVGSLQAPTLAPLPPPPPFRQGIDNPSILGPPGSGYEEGSAARDQGRLDRKPNIPHRRGETTGTLGRGDGWRGVAMGNWNSRNQGPGPGNAFPPYQPHHYGAHPPAVFPGIGQQFSGPPIFGPGGVGRAPMDMNFGGRFMGPGNRLGDGEAFHVQGRGSGWRGPTGDDDLRPPVLVPVEGWEGQGHPNDEIRHGWDRAVGPMGSRPWERDRDVWDGRPRDVNMEFLPRAPIDSPHQVRASGQGASWGIPFEVKTGEAKIIEKPSLVRSNQDKAEAISSKVASEDPMVAKPVEDDKFRNRALAAMRTLLSKLDISPELAGPKLYRDYKSFVSAGDMNISPKTDVMQEAKVSDLSDGDCILDADLEAEALLSQSRSSEEVFPPVPEGAFEAALSAYRKLEGENLIQKSFIGSFILPSNPKPDGFHRFLMQRVIEQSPATDKLLLDTNTTPHSDIGSAMVDESILNDQADGGNGKAIPPKLSCSFDTDLTPQGSIPPLDTKNGDDDHNMEAEDEIYDASLGVQKSDLDVAVVAGQQEPVNSQDLKRDFVILDDIMVAEGGERVNSQADTCLSSFEPHITSVTQSACSEACESSTIDDLVGLVEHSEAPCLGDSLLEVPNVSKENDDQDVDERGFFGSEVVAVVGDSNGEIKELVGSQLIGDEKIENLESEKDCNESEKCYSEVKEQSFLEKEVVHEAGIYVEEGVKELACFMYILKRNRNFIRIRTFQLTTWFHRRLDILTSQVSTIHQVTGKLWIPCLTIYWDLIFGCCDRKVTLVG